MLKSTTQRFARAGATRHRHILAYMALSLNALPGLFAQTPDSDLPPSEPSPPSEAKAEPEPATPSEGLKPSAFTKENARTFNFTVPAPRGQILDLKGRVLANNRVRHYLAIQLPPAQNVLEAEIIGAAKGALNRANFALGTAWYVDDETILAHHTNRRWFPLRVSPRPLTEEEEKKISRLLPEPIEGQKGTLLGLTFQKVYMRQYPAGPSSGHILGYVGKETPLETTEIRSEELLFEDFEGRAGLEKQFNDLLTGKDGTVNFTFDQSGELVETRVIAAPEPGDNVVTTLNIEMQLTAEAVLAEKSKRGAAVVVNADTGDIYAMASHPGFDPNDFIPYIGQAEFDQLNNDPAVPLYGRAFSAAYPPGSTFKPIVACAVLTHGPVHVNTLYPGPPSLFIGDRDFKNWNKEDEGMLDVVGALRRSCNTWFYQAALDTGSTPLIQTASEFGFGERTGIPIAGEAKGSLPQRWELPGGEIANTSIGQGEVLVTPLQLAVAIAAIGNGQHFPRARLVSQTQDFRNKVTGHFPNASRGYMPYALETIDAVQIGMDEVVNSGNGTAARARLEKIRVAGKTGTAQWASGDGQPRHLAWFCGFTFTSNPRLAFAVVYESELGETVSGGRLGAPIAHDILEKIYDQPATYAFADPIATEPPVDRFAIARAAAPAAPAVLVPQTLPGEREEKKATNNPIESFFKGIFGRR